MDVTPGKIVFFDGFCGFCDSAVSWAMPRDRAGILRFAPIQGKAAQAMLSRDLTARATPDTILYLRDGQVFERSTAILRVLMDLGGAYRLAAPLLAVPRPVRDFFYDLFARNRYRLFGKRDSCRLPTPAERARMLD